MEKKSFRDFGISREIIDAITKLNYINPSEVQERVIPAALENRDIIVKAQTGSGKTASFGIPVCQKVEIEENNPQVLILTPTRELCLQVKEEVSNIGRLKRVRCAAVFGKQPFDTQVRELKQRTHVVVGTPGRTFDHIERGSLNTEGIRYLIIDEADEMLNMGFIEQVESIINKLPKQRVTMLFSATIPEAVERLCQRYMNGPEKIEITPREITTERIEHLYYEVREEDKFSLLNKLLIVEKPDSCIIFCRTKENVDNLVGKLKEKDYPCRGLHGGMLQDDRLDVMKRFKRGEFMFLVATDVAARGIDVENVTHIINYDIPMEKESYVHRIGRTGRAGREGKALTFVTFHEQRFLNDIEDYVGFRLTRAYTPTEDEVKESRKSFREKISAQPKLKKEKGSELNREITKIYINAGKKKKIRAGDIVGAITRIEGVSAEDIGIIDVQDNFSYIDILNKKGKAVMEGLKEGTVKGKTVRVEKAEK